MTKLGEGHTPPSAAMVRSGWCSSCVGVATLLTTKMDFHRQRRVGHWIRPFGDMTTEIGGWAMSMTTGWKGGENPWWNLPQPHGRMQVVVSRVMSPCGTLHLKLAQI